MGSLSVRAGFLVSENWDKEYAPLYKRITLHVQNNKMAYVKKCSLVDIIHTNNMANSSAEDFETY